MPAKNYAAKRNQLQSLLIAYFIKK